MLASLNIRHIKQVVKLIKYSWVLGISIRLYSIDYNSTREYYPYTNICLYKAPFKLFVLVLEKNTLVSDSRVYNATKFGTHFRACQECVSISIKLLVFRLSPTKSFLQY